MYIYIYIYISICVYIYIYITAYPFRQLYKYTNMQMPKCWFSTHKYAIVKLRRLRNRLIIQVALWGQFERQLLMCRYCYLAGFYSGAIQREATGGPLETTGDHRGQFQRTDFGAARESSPLPTLPGPLKLILPFGVYKMYF